MPQHADAGTRHIAQYTVCTGVLLPEFCRIALGCRHVLQSQALDVVLDQLDPMRRQIKGVHHAGLRHACRNGTGLSARCGTEVQDRFPGFCAQRQSTDLGREILHIKPTLAEFRQLSDIAGVQLICAGQICGTDGISQCLFQFCTGTRRRILPDKPACQSVRQECTGRLFSIGIQQLFQQPLRHCIFHCHCRLFPLGIRHFALVPEKTTQHSVHKAGCAGFPAGFRQLYTLIDCRTGRNLVAVQQLINAQTKNVPHGTVQLSQRLLAVVGDHRIQGNTPFDHAVIQRCAEPFIPVVQLRLGQCAVQQQVGIALLLFGSVQQLYCQFSCTHLRLFLFEMFSRRISCKMLLSRAAT